ncbi:unnamed protein product, partial [Staurois parvus]
PTSSAHLCPEVHPPVPPSSATHLCPEVPPTSAHPHVPTSATHQCPSVQPNSAASQCHYQCHLSVLSISAIYQCRLSVTPH